MLHVGTRTKLSSTKFFILCFKVVMEQSPHLHRRFIEADFLAKLINDKCSIPSNVKIEKKTVNTAFGTLTPYKLADLLVLTATNPTQVYRSNYTPNGGTTENAYCYVPNATELPPRLPSYEWWKKWARNDKDIPEATRKRAAKPTGTVVSTKNTQKRAKTKEKVEQRDNLRSKSKEKEKLADLVDKATIAALNRNEDMTNDESCPNALTYWTSGEAKRIFGIANPVDEDEEETPLQEILLKRIKRLKDAFLSPSGWREVIDDRDADNLYSEADQFRLRRACKYLAAALVIALAYLVPGQFTWTNCCELALGTINRQESTVVAGVDGSLLEWELSIEDRRVQFLKPLEQENPHALTNAKYLMTLHKSIRTNNEQFQNRHKATKNGKTALPPLLDAYPEAKDSMIRYAKGNLNHLSSERVYSHVHETILPGLVEVKNQEVKDETGELGTYTVESILKENGLVKLSIPTIYRWMRRLGFKYEVRKKCYYVDTHEKPDNKRYRKRYAREYRELELRMFRWVQISHQDFLYLQQTNKFKEHELVAKGYEYACPDGRRIIEFHVDDHPMFQENLSHTQFGGSLSVRNPKPNRPLIAFGQDECIFKQYIFTTKVWSAPDGTKGLVPKDEGLGVMISAFVSREFGFLFELTEEQFMQVNLFRRGESNCVYRDSEAATKKLGTDRKADLVKSPFLVEFEYGANGDGYWTYESMVLQVEDCIDVVQALYPQFDFLFQFDHSCGHDRKRPDGLNALSVRKGFSDNQPRMRATRIDDEHNIGSYNTTVSIGEQYSLVWGDGEDEAGPCWMTAEERALFREDRPCPQGKIETYKYKKDELIEKLSARNLSTTGNKTALTQRCQNHGIAVTEERPVVINGWRGKPKGAFQILWDRGFLSSNVYKDYTMDGRSDPMGNPIEGTSLKAMLAALPDFQQEKTLLQHHVEGRSVPNGQQIMLIRSPKCHPEVAGEGIEYAWAVAKQWYRRLPLSKKKSKENFRKNVTQSMKNITVRAMRSMSKRAREYIVAYDVLSRWKDIHGADSEVPETSAKLLDRLVDQRRSHRSVSHDNPWVKMLMESMASSQ